MRMKKILKTVAFGLCLISPVLALAFPGIPHQFYGSVKFADDNAALDGTVVEAKINDVLIVSVSTKDGKYGYNPDLFYVTDLDSSNTRSGDEIQFFVNGLDASSSVTFSNGKIQNLDLSLSLVSIGTLNNTAGTVVTDETVVVVPDTPTVVNMGSGDLSVSLSPSGTSGTNAVIDKIEKLTDSFFTGATAIISGNNLLNAYEIKITGEGLSITVTMKYDDSTVDEDTIKPYIFDGSGWVEIAPFIIDKVANTLTFTISSAQTPYAIFGEIAQAVATPVVTPAGGGGGGGGGYTPPADTSAAIIGDINGNFVVDKYDFALMMSAWGKTGSSLTADLNNDGKVDKYDFALLMVNWSI